MKTNTFLTSILALGALVAPLHAATIVDDFNRADVASTSNGADIGTGWVIGSGEFALISNRIRVNTNLETMVLDSVMWNTGVTLQQGNFEASLTRFSVTNPRTSGLAFMVQDADSYYALRIGGVSDTETKWEFIQNDNGTVSVLQTGNASAAWNAATPYDITVSSTAANTYTIKIDNLTTSTTVVNTTITQAGLPSTGYAGLYYFQNSGQYLFDDFSASSPIPEPSSAALLIGAVAGLALLRRHRR